jgi:hypothetical protein
MLEQKLFDALSPLDQLEHALRERSEAFSDIVIPANHIRMHPETGHLELPHGSWDEAPLQDQAMDHIAVKLHIPATYLRRCPTRLRAENVNHWFKGLGYKRLLVRFDRAEVRAILTPSYVSINNVDLVHRFCQMAETKGLRLVVRYEWTASRFVAQIVETKRDLAVPGDTMLGGIQLINSETGDASLSVSALLYRLVCTNGMTVSDSFGFRRVHRRAPEELVDELTETVDTIWDRLPTLVEPVRYLAGINLADPFREIDLLSKRFQLSEEQQVRIHQAWLIEPGHTQLFLLHALTRAANNADLPLTERTQLQAIAGELLASRT